MSSWSFEMKIDVDKLNELARSLGNVPMMLGEVADQAKTEVKSQIEAKNIIDTGALLASIESGMSGDSSFVRDGVSYGVYNEFGTYKMAARPFFVPSVEKMGEVIEKKFTELMR